ncbi:MAG: DUF2167 domain-containing protein [Hymenobacter sp.]|nr:MAG: DUF2167 domain-containing protein [Hymenobacter sp.]
MKKSLLHLLLLLLGAATVLAKPAPKPAKPAAKVVAIDSAAVYQAIIDSMQRSLTYQTGHLTLPGGVGELTVPAGYRYLDSAQSRRVLTKYWHNPDGTSLGMLFPKDKGPLDEHSWAYVIEYNPMGYVKDDDASDINYTELLADMQKEMEEENPEREKSGFEAIHLMGWGATPYYDKAQHTLHWAKLLRFGSSPDSTLNYNVRLLGRKGVLVLNAVASPEQLPAIKASIPGLLANVSFAKGQQYTDYNAGIDEVAAYTIGGLVAGKVLAKVGFFAIILKFWKLGILALGGAWAAIKRFFGIGTKEA